MRWVPVVFAALAVLPASGQERVDLAPQEPAFQSPTRDWGKLYVQTWEMRQLERVHRGDGVEAWQIAYKSLEEGITGFLARPYISINERTGKPAERFPAIILCHDGGRGVTQPYRQAAIELAKMGYVVAASSYRGNYGIEGQSQGRREFGKSEVIDVLQLAQLVRKADYVDSQRMIIVGEGEGGLIASQIIGRSNIFRGAVLVSPYLFSGMSQYGYAGARTYAEVAQKVFGRRLSESEILRGVRDRDSFRFIDQVTAPTLVILDGSQRDETALNRWIAALTRNGVKTEVLRYQGAAPGFLWSPSTRFNAWDNMVRWIEAYAPPN